MRRHHHQLYTGEFSDSNTLIHSEYDKRIVIDSGGLGDFYSHGFDCSWLKKMKSNLLVFIRDPKGIK